MLLRSPLWPSTRRKPPFGAVVLDRGHPLARGLEFFTLLRPTEPTGGIDMVRRGGGVTTGSANRSSRGLRTVSGALTSWASGKVGGDAPYIASTGLTLAWRGVIANANGFHGFLSKTSGTNTNCPFWFFSDNGGVGGQYQFFLRRGSATQAVDFTTNGTQFLQNAVNECVVTCADNLIQTAPTGYINGKPTTGTNGSGTGATTGASAALNIGRDPGGSVQLVGETIHAAVWSRPLTAAEVAWFYAEPYAMLRPVVRRRLAWPLTQIKTVSGLAEANVKTVEGLANASVKTILGLP